METMMGFDDEQIREGEWRVLAKTPDRPFVLGGAPVVTCTISDRRGRSWVWVRAPGRRGSPAVIADAEPAQLASRSALAPVLLPSVDEVNFAQAALSTAHCFTNIQSAELDALLQPEFETVRLGIDAFNIDHIDSKMKLYEILLNQPLVVGKLQPGRVSRGAGSPEHRRRVDAKYTGFPRAQATSEAREGRRPAHRRRPGGGSRRSNVAAAAEPIRRARTTQ